MGPVIDNNEAVSLVDDLVITPQMIISGYESSGRVDFIIKKNVDELMEEIICITEGKQNQHGIGVAQNLIQCKSSCDVNIVHFSIDLLIRIFFKKIVYYC